MNLYIISTLFSGEHLILIIAAIVFLFGGKKIPELMGGIGKGMKEFKNAIKEDEPEKEAKEVKKEEPKEISASETSENKENPNPGTKDQSTELKA